MGNEPSIHWEFLDFPALDTVRLYAILRARSEVFVVEQNCFYLDCDNLDQKSHHLVGWAGPEKVAAYMRVIPPGEKYHEPAMGRLFTTRPYRKTGLGRELTERGIAHIRKLYPGQGIRISAQKYLEKFYLEIGFKTVSEPYEDAGIPHIEMLLPVGK